MVQRYTVNVNCPVFGYTVHGLFTLRLEKDRAADFYRFVHTTEFHILHCYETETGTVFIDAHFQSEEKGMPSFRSSRPTAPAACTGW